jgi:uncharacterized protein YbjT (DUF2867 family)
MFREEPMHVVTGASGHTGSVVAKELLATGHAVRAVGRSAERLSSLGDLGAEILEADLSDRADASRAFRDADCAYVLIPPTFADPDFRGWQRRVGEAITEGIRSAGVPRVVNLSSLGAQHPGGTGPIAGLGEQERRLDALGLHVLHLRPASFMENLYMSLAGIRRTGVLGMALSPDLAMPLIATRDIGAYAARRMAASDWVGREVRELLGPRAYTPAEMATAIGPAIGRPDLPYVQVSYEQARGYLESLGLPAASAGVLVEMYRAYNDGLLDPEEERSPENTTPTTLEEFSRGLAAAWAAGADGGH